MQDNLLRFNTSKRLLFFDFESLNLNLNFCHNRVWQAGFIEMTGKTETASLDLLIKWDSTLKCSEDAARINHYDQRKIDRLGISPEEAFAKFEPLFARADWIAGHNILNFDYPLCQEYYKYMGKKFDMVDKVIDTNLIAKGIKLNIPYNPKDSFLEYQYKLLNKRAKVKTRLSVLAAEYGIAFDEGKLHDSCYDLSINIALFNKLIYQIEI